MTATQVLQSHPHKSMKIEGAAQLIQSAQECADSCTACADACLNESDPGSLATCIRLALDCADICGATGRVLSRLTQASTRHIRAIIEACEAACRVCAKQCEQHTDHSHCLVCAQVCRQCEQHCLEALGNMS